MDVLSYRQSSVPFFYGKVHLFLRIPPIYGNNDIVTVKPEGLGRPQAFGIIIEQQSLVAFYAFGPTLPQ